MLGEVVPSGAERLQVQFLGAGRDRVLDCILPLLFGDQIGDGGDQKSTPINSVEFLPMLEARARTYGFKIRVKYGEPFQSLKPLPLNNFDIFNT